jgi:DNA (cytosine-5)-methyltransferase 1
MRHGSLFSGIGGFDLAAQWMGWENLFHCEWEDFPRKVLKHHFTESISYGDIEQTDFTIWRDRVEILSGGFPCQPFSTAGKRKGKNDDRYLWPEMLRAIREIRPGWVVGENVRGLINWDGGMVFDQVCSDLEAEGYKVIPVLLPAAAVNAPHRRDRIWFIAHSHQSNDRGKSRKNEAQSPGEWIQERHKIWEITQPGKIRSTISETPTDSNGYGQHDQQTQSNKRERQNSQQSGRGWECATEGFSNEWTPTDSQGQLIKREHLQQPEQGKPGGFNSTDEPVPWEQFPTKSPICGGDDGIPRELDSITFPKWRSESIKAYGNAIVPQVALQIFRTIELMEGQNAQLLSQNKGGG